MEKISSNKTLKQIEKDADRDVEKIMKIQADAS